jgi:hypothetical protein
MDKDSIQYAIANTRVLRPFPVLLLEGTSMEMPFSAVMEDADRVGTVRVLDGRLFARIMLRQELREDEVRALLEGFESDEAWKYAEQEMPKLFRLNGCVGIGKVIIEGHSLTSALEAVCDRVVSDPARRLIIRTEHSGWEVGLLSSAARGITIRLQSGGPRR